MSTDAFVSSGFGALMGDVIQTANAVMWELSEFDHPEAVERMAADAVKDAMRDSQAACEDLTEPIPGATWLTTERHRRSLEASLTRLQQARL